jgi:AraC-like DNA-binding protein
MLLLDLLLRFSAFGLLLSLAILSMRGSKNVKRNRLLAVLCISLMALMLSTLPNEIDLSLELRIITSLIDAPNTVLAWLFVKSLLKDDFHIDITHTLLAALFCVAYWFLILSLAFKWIVILPVHWIILNLYALGLFIHLSADILQDWKNDLVESRRRLRLIFVCAITVMVGFLIATELFSIYFDRSIMDLLKVMVTFLLTLFGHLWFLDMAPRYAITTNQVQKSIVALSESEQSLQCQILTQMEAKEVWRNPSLTIKSLAGIIGVGEHKLRAFINHRLGYRNFANYIQDYRLSAAKKLLADPYKRDTQILTLALECGFNSISTFNRVFLKTQGVSPSSFRDMKIGIKDPHASKTHI